jgi:hypothetical protein
MPCRPKRKPSGRSRFVLSGPNPGLRKDGNIDLYARPLVPDPQGGFATVLSMSFGRDVGEILVPTVVRNRIVSDQAAMREYDRTGKHLGIFDGWRHADRYAERLHLQQARIYCLG